MTDEPEKTPEQLAQETYEFMCERYGGAFRKWDDLHPSIRAYYVGVARYFRETGQI